MAGLATKINPKTNNSKPNEQLAPVPSDLEGGEEERVGAEYGVVLGTERDAEGSGGTDESGREVPETEQDNYEHQYTSTKTEYMDGQDADDEGDTDEEDEVRKIKLQRESNIGAWDGDRGQLSKQDRKLACEGTY